MSIVDGKFYNIQCDCCKEIINENWYNNPDDANTEADQGSYILELGGRHYCPRCYRHDDEDNIITSDGRKFDGDTMEELDNSDYFVRKATEIVCHTTKPESFLESNTTARLIAKQAVMLAIEMRDKKGGNG